MFRRSAAGAWCLESQFTADYPVTISGDVRLAGDILTVGNAVHVRSGAAWTKQFTLPIGPARAVEGDWLALGDPRANFVYLYQRSAGNWSYVQTVGSGTNPIAKAGAMLCESLAPNAACSFLFLMPRDLIALEGRASAGASATRGATLYDRFVPEWLKLVRSEQRLHDGRVQFDHAELSERRNPGQRGRVHLCLPAAER